MAQGVTGSTSTFDDHFLALAQRSVDRLAEQSRSTWLVNLVEDGAYTPVVAGGPLSDGLVGVVLSWRETLCAELLRDGLPVVVPDLATAGSPGVREIARAWGLRSYGGTALTDPAGRLLGTLCGVSPEPLEDDVLDWWPVLLRSHADLLATDLLRALTATGEAAGTS